MSKVKPRTKLVAIHPVHGYAIPPPQDVKVSRRNARERNRVKTVNNGFEMLKRHIPSARAAKKMSKVNILNQAVEYIEALQGMLTEESSPNKGPMSPKVSSFTSSNPGGQALPNYSSSYPANKADHHVQATPPPYHHTKTSQQPPYTPPASCYLSPYPSPSPSSAPPLTPISPNTMYYPHYTPRSYESGYDSSNGDNNVIEMDRKPSSWHNQDYQHQQHHSAFTRLSPTSPNAHYVVPNPLIPSKVEDNQNESSGEEDDILDAIAEWQQH